jgi:hypothetical protein
MYEVATLRDHGVLSAERARDIRNAPGTIGAWLSVAGFPVLFVLAFTALLALPATRPAALLQVHEDPSVRELYAVEIATFWIALLAGLVGVGLCIWRDMAPLERAFFAVFSAGMVFIAMEEGAWGQWLHHYDTPGWMVDMNAQGEMTLHNIGPLQGNSELFRLVFGVGGLVGLLAPMRWVDRIRVPWSLAGTLAIITAFAAIDTIGDYGAVPGRINYYFARMSEIVELLIAYTGLMYLSLHLYCRLKWRASAVSAWHR